jgi:HlyD family secretion protein
VAAVVETAVGDFCWIKTAEGTERRCLQLGDTNDQFIVVKTGLKQADEVVIDPLASIAEAQMLALKPRDDATPGELAKLETDHVD